MRPPVRYSESIRPPIVFPNISALRPRSAMQDSSRVVARFALVLLAALAFQSVSAGHATKPSAAIDALHASLLDVMKNATALGYAGREQKLRVVIPQYFDVDTMAKQSLGGQQWKAASPDAQRRYLE